MICITVTESDGEYISSDQTVMQAMQRKGGISSVPLSPALIVNTMKFRGNIDQEDLIISGAGDGYVYFHSRMGILKVPHFL